MPFKKDAYICVFILVIEGTCFPLRYITHCICQTFVTYFLLKAQSHQCARYILNQADLGYYGTPTGNLALIGGHRGHISYRPGSGSGQKSRSLQ